MFSLAISQSTFSLGAVPESKYNNCPEAVYKEVSITSFIDFDKNRDICEILFMPYGLYIITEFGTFHRAIGWTYNRNIIENM